jgi:lipopolysaccharide export system ATP-binding protein
MAKLQALQLEKQYRGRKVVKNVSLTIGQGEIVGLLGPNGAGKTTSFYMMVGLIQCDRGQVLLDDTDITYSPIHERARAGIGYLPQESSIFRRLNVAQNILAVLELRKTLNKQQRTTLLESLMQELHIAHLRDSPGFTLSGGERRRVEIARALAMEPHFILLDEPFAGIDPISVIDIKRIILHLRDRKIGVLITDHNVRETLDICQRAYIASEGKIIAEGAPDSIMANQHVREVYLGHEFDL